MGMVVRTNMAALGANNSLAQASKAQQSGMQKLYTGFKINAAKDDASGLAISEKMKNQIKALDTAKDNCEDGANMIQTAEGYMKETHDILTRMTELAEKSANGLLETEDRKALQNEMDELCGEIDRMATTANFNGRKLLDGSLGGKESITLTCDSDAKTISYNKPTDTSNSKPTVNGMDVDASALEKDVYTYDESQGKWFDSNNQEATITLSFKDGDTITYDDDGKVSTTANGASVTVTTDTDKAGKTFTYNKEDDEWQRTDDPTKTTTVDAKIEDGASFSTMDKGIKLQIGESSTSADRLDVKINSFHTDTLFAGLHGFKNTTNDSTDVAADAKVKIKGVTEDPTTHELTVASDGSGNESSTYKNAVSIDITDQNSASAAADAIRQISNYVSDERGKLGAQQNRLEHTVNNLATASENTTAAKSRILDTDMAKEMMEYTSKNVIAQAAQSMLAQANSQPQNVLSLLQ